jgi:predicted enzyme related to lactoylglutathione lyase
MIEALAAVWLPVTDVDRAVDFYGDTLGLEVEQHESDWAIVAAGHVRVGLNGNPEEPAGEGGAVIAFAVGDELEDAIDQLNAAGAEVSDISVLPWGRVATFHDPDGNQLQLFEPADE